MKIRHITSIFIMLLCISWAGQAFAQKPVAQFASDALPSQMLEWLNKGTSQDDKKQANGKLMKQFLPIYEAQSPQMQERVTAICNTMVEVKVRPVPDASDFVGVLVAYYTASPANFEQWISTIEFIQHRNKKVKDFTDFVEFSVGLLKDQTLYKSRSCTWQAQAGASFSLRQEGDDLLVVFDKPFELYYSSDRDNGTIYGTTGAYYYFDNKWKGQGGRINWDRCGIPTSACWAVLGKYEAVTKFAKFTADSVQFTNTNYFNKPIYGRIEESLSAKAEPDKYTFPKFRSYQTDFQIKDVLPGIDYRGSFMMHGAKFVTNDEKNPATLIFYRDSKPFLTVSSTKFTITHAKMTSEHAAVTIYVADHDSITNNGITVRYLVSDKKVTLINENKRNYYSPYTDSYHNLDMYCESIVWKTNGDELEMSMLGQSSTQSFSTFESRNYYSAAKFREIQGIDHINPVVRVYNYMKTRGMAKEFYVDELAKYLKLDLIQTKSMVHTLAKSGLVSFNESMGMIYVQDKLLDYVMAFNKAKGKDYDAISIESSAKGNNAVLDLKSSDLRMYGVKQFVVSDSQRVVVFPQGGDIVVKQNRDISFSGRINVGKFVMYVTNGEFSYANFNFELPRIDSIYFYVTQFNDPNKERLVITPLYNLVGNIQIDKPDNHCGLKKNKEYPIFNSLQESFVYYDRKNIVGGTYVRDRFYYTLRPFVIKQLTDFETDSLQFNGSLTSAGIFPEIDEPLRVQPDYSLGFVINTPKGGYDAYGGKGHYTSTIDLSHKGLRGRGQVDYLTSVTRSNNITFTPDSMVAITDTFYVKEQGGFPDIRNGKAHQRWFPYADSMQVLQLAKGTPFQMYRGDASLAGYVTLHPDQATASGAATIREGMLESKRFALQPREMNSQVSAFTLRSDIHRNIAFAANNMKSHVDFDKRRAEFTSNAPQERTMLPVVQYVAYVDKFGWEMDQKRLDLINSKSETTGGLEGLGIRERLDHKDLPGARFVSTDPQKDSLQFFTTHGTYLYDAGELSCRNVFLVNVADAAIAPKGDTLHVRPGGEIDLLRHSQVLASRTNRYHLFYDADVMIKSAKYYSAKGNIDYEDEDLKKQKIYMTEIAPNSNGVSVAEGFINDSANFTLSSAFGFAGKVRVTADREHYYFDGGVRLLHHCTATSDLALLAYADYLDPKDIHVVVPEVPTDWKRQPIAAAILFEPNTLKPTPAFLTNNRPANNELVSAFGDLVYDKASHQYKIASPAKLADFDNKVGRYLALNTDDCTVTGEGPIKMGIGGGLTKVFAYGNATTSTRNDNLAEVNTIFGFTFPIDNGVLNTMAQYIAEDLRLSPSNPDNELLRHAMVYYMGEENGNEAYSDYVSTGSYNKSPKEFESSILFENLRWSYSPTLGYYYNGVASLASIGKKQLHLATRVKAQIYKRGASTSLILYVQVASDHWYFFNYDFTSQQMNIQSSVGEWVDMIKAIPAEKRQISEKQGSFKYRISSNQSEIRNFLLRIEGQNAPDLGSDDEEDVEYEEGEE